jgi:GNS1/SUR4 family
VRLVWWFFLYNFTFFAEIFIFVLGKRHDRITNYFLYHHIALPLSIWWIVRFSPTGHSLFFGLVNCSVHVCSFGYLVVIGAFPAVKASFGWWRTFFHSLLVLRLVLIVLHALQLFVWNTCRYPMVYPLIVLLNAPLFIVLTISDHLLSDQKRRSRREYFVGRHDSSNS